VRIAKYDHRPQMIQLVPEPTDSPPIKTPIPAHQPATLGEPSPYNYSSATKVTDLNRIQFN
jgi:hypothetical protein